jgi:hypothetical protein
VGWIRAIHGVAFLVAQWGQKAAAGAQPSERRPALILTRRRGRRRGHSHRWVLQAEPGLQRVSNGDPLLGPGPGLRALSLLKDHVLDFLGVWNLAKDHQLAPSGCVDGQVAKVQQLRQLSFYDQLDILDIEQRGLGAVLAPEGGKLALNHAFVGHDVAVVAVIGDPVPDEGQGGQDQERAGELDPKDAH